LFHHRGEPGRRKDAVYRTDTNVVPIAATASENVQRLRNWANGRCLSADRSGLYQATPTPAKAGSKAARKIERPTDPEMN
jgi:hypothetical protein